MTTTADQIKALDDQITAIENKHADHPDNHAAVITTNSLLFRYLRSKDRNTAAANLKAHIAKHVDNPELHADLLTVVELFTEIIELVRAEVKAEKSN